MFESLIKFIDRLVTTFGKLVSYCTFFLMIAILLQVFLRYGLGKGLIALEELQWHFYATIIMVGLSSTLIHNKHVRVDVLSSHFSLKTKAVIEFLGLSILLFPFCYILIDHGLDYFLVSFKTGEVSPSPGGLPMRWVIKLLIPFSSLLLFMAGFSQLLKCLLVILGQKRSLTA